MTDYISRADAIDFITKLMDRDCAPCDFTEHDKIAVICYQTAIKALSALPASEYEEADGVITIEKQSAKDVGEIKHIIIRSPNYTRYFYNESMPTSADAVSRKDTVTLNSPISIQAEMVAVVRCKDCIHWKADNEVFELGFCCVFPQKWVAETFYCADGERREP